LALNGGSIEDLAGEAAVLALPTTGTDGLATKNIVIDTTPPTVTINQMMGQPDPTNGTPINFTVVFSESVSDFATGDVTLGGTAGATTATVTGSGTTYNVAVSGMTGSGTVIASLLAGVAHDTAGNPSVASTSTDNMVIYDTGIHTWDGGGGDNKWTTAANWVGDIAPLPGENLIFPTGANQLESVNDYPADTVFGSITVSGSGYCFHNGVQSTSNMQVQSGVQLETDKIVTDTLTIGAGAVVTISPIVATRTWDGGSTENSLWTTAENWVGDVAPLPGDNLIFPEGVAQLESVNNYPTGTHFGSITVSGSGYHFQNNDSSFSSVQLQSGAQLEVDKIVTGTLTIGAGATVTIAPIAGGPSSTLAIQGPITQLPVTVVNNSPTFTLLTPTTGTYVNGDTITITWTASDVVAGSVITLCLDTDTTLWNGNEKWIEVDKVSASSGTNSYTYTLSGVSVGTYYVGGYLYNPTTKTFTYSHLTKAITVPAATFTLTGPASGTYAPGQSVTITWTAANVSSNDVVTLCLDKDTTMWNGNEKWIEVDKVAASAGTYTFTMPNVAAGSYYVAGYMYDKATYAFTYSYLLQSVTIAANSSQSQSAALSTLTSNVGGSIGVPAAQSGTDGASLVDNTSNLVVMTKDLVFSAGETMPSSFSQRLTDASGANNQDEEELFASTDRKEEQSAVDAALQDQDIWLEKASADWLA
jgi:hypothetical protein